MDKTHTAENKLFGCFDALYIINLAHRSDRREEMEVELKKVGLSLRSPGVVLFSAVRPVDAGSFPSIGAQGCFMSHLKVLEDALDKNLSTILIIEDDCNFSSDWVERLASFERTTPNASWDIFYGGTLSETTQLNSNFGFSLLDPNFSLSGTHCLAVSKKTLPLIIKYFHLMMSREPGHPDGGPMHVDGAYSWFRRSHPFLNTIIAIPHIASQRSSLTDIHKLKWFDRIKLFAPVMRSFRKIKNKVSNF